MTIEIITDDWQNYQLLDSGDGERLEQVGDRIIRRSEPRAWWQKNLPPAEWEKAQAVFMGGEERGEWQISPGLSRNWQIDFDTLKINLKLTQTSKHIGVFPEQSVHWRFISDTIKNQKRQVNVLNLFGYTGMGSLVAAAAGAKVTHVDASKQAVTWARENQDSSGLSDKPIRWIMDDVVKFVKREVKRGNKYDAIIMDPPAFGRGPQGQVWKVEKMLPELLEFCREILSPDPLFILLTAYSVDSSSISIANLLQDTMKNYKGQIEFGELALKQSQTDRLLPLSIFSLWKK